MNIERVSWGWFRVSIVVCAVGVLLTWSGSAQAYAWMIRHDYAGCNMCHADPSGGGLLTGYGRAQSEVLLRTHYWGEKANDEPGKISQFLFGAVTLPDSVLLGADFRVMQMHMAISGAPTTDQLIWMQADLEGQWSVDRFHVNGSIGYVPLGDLPASLTHSSQENLVSRVHWVGVDLDEDKQWMVRAGRMNLPFGIRSIEHTCWVRTLTQTDIDATQEDGLAVAYNGSGLRGEAMAIFGNMQLSPAAYRQRGYAAFLEWAPITGLAVGVDSLATHADRDVTLQTPLWRQAYGIFGRWAPVRPVVVSSEWDLTFQSQPATAFAGAKNTQGTAGMLNLDVEPIQGIHVGTTGELLASPLSGPGSSPPSLAAWGTLQWFFAPRLDIRGDVIVQSIAAGDSRTSVTTLLGQFHAFL